MDFKLGHYRISDDQTVSDRIHNAVMAERSKGIMDAIAAIMDFEPQNSYIVLIAAGSIEAETLTALPPGPDCTFIFVTPMHGLAVWETACQMEISASSVIFIEDGCISEDVSVDGAKLVRVKVPPGKKLRDVMTEPDSIFMRMIEESVRAQEREMCAKIADRWHGKDPQGHPELISHEIRIGK